MSGNWEQLRAGVGCPLCAPRPDIDEHVFLVRKLAVSSLYLTCDQTYRGRCVLVYDVGHANRLDALALEPWLVLARDLWIAARALALVFDPGHMNVESLGNEVPHLHWHLIPRYVDDGRWRGHIWAADPAGPRTLRLDETQYVEMARALDEAIKTLEGAGR